MGSYTVENHKVALKVLQQMNVDRKCGKYCDIILVVENKEYFAHKSVLAAFSPFFEAMFTGNYAEAYQSKIELLSVESCALEVILDYAYVKDVEISDENVEAVMHASHLMQESRLFDSCCDFLKWKLSAENCIGFYKIGKLYMNQGLIQKSRSYWMSNFLDVSFEEEFLNVEIDELIEIIDDENLFVECEDEVFEAIIRWCSYREEERSSCLDKLLRHVRLAHVSPDLLRERIDSDVAFQISKVSMNLLNKIKWYHMMPKWGMKLDSSLTRRRPSWPVEVLAIWVKDHGAWILDKTYKELYITENGEVVHQKGFDTATKKEIRNDRVLVYGDTTAAIRKTMPAIYDAKTCNFDRHYFACNEECEYAFLDGYWYGIGGTSCYPFAVSNQVVRVKSYDRIPEEVAPLPLGVFKSRTVSLKGKIYVIGGMKSFTYRDYDDAAATKCVQRYDPINNTWEQMTPLPVIREVLGACALDDHIFVCVGIDPAKPKNKKFMLPKSKKQQVYKYNTITNDWESCEDLNHVYSSGPSVYKGEIYVISLTRPTNRPCIERYSPVTGKWKVFADIPRATPLCIFGPLVIRCFKNEVEDTRFLSQEDREPLKLRLL